MKLLNAITVLMGAMSLTGCATAQLDNLKDAQGQRGMLVEQNISFVFGSSAMLLSGTQAGLFPGYYVVTKENENGAFYRGAGQCVWYKGDTEYGVLTGGIWLPKNADNPARLFSVLGEPTSRAKSLEELAVLCRQPTPSDGTKGLTSGDLQATLTVTPQALGVQPAGPNGTLSGSQAVGAGIAMGLVKIIVDNAKGDYQVTQKVEDPEALRKIAEAVKLAEKVQEK